MPHCYILSNPGMLDDLYKIGFTGQDDLSARVAQLFNGSTGVPSPFDIEFSVSVQNAREVEVALHALFADTRLWRSREFFRLSETQLEGLKQLLRLYGKESTPSVAEQAADLPVEEKSAFVQRPRLGPVDLLKIGAEGDEIVFWGTDHKATIKDSRTILFQGELASMTNAMGKIRPDIASNAALYWMLKGTSIYELWQRANGRAT